MGFLFFVVQKEPANCRWLFVLFCVFAFIKCCWIIGVLARRSVFMFFRFRSHSRSDNHVSLSVALTPTVTLRGPDPKDFARCRVKRRCISPTLSNLSGRFRQRSVECVGGALVRESSSASLDFITLYF